MSNAGVKELLTLLDASYRGDPEHSLLGALWTVDDETWSAVPGNEGRTVRGIAQHAATALHAYYNAAFADGEGTWEAAAAVAATKRSKEDVVAWATEAHEAILAAVSKLTDHDLGAPRAAHWGGIVPTRRILLTLIGHAYYHAGEINHLRSVLQGNDRWDYWGEEMPAVDAETG
jgi:uncharacterized damage-inducible protein DinB